MKIEDFYKLCVGQEIYCLDRQDTILELGLGTGGALKISLLKYGSTLWGTIYKNCSKEAPKQKIKVKLYRYTYQDPSVVDAFHVEQTTWRSYAWNTHSAYTLLGTEEKEIEVEDD